MDHDPPLKFLRFLGNANLCWVGVVVETLLPCQNLLVRELSLSNAGTQIIIDKIIIDECARRNYYFPWLP